MRMFMILVVIGFGPSPMSNAADPAGNRIVFPVTTELQRTLLKEPDCRAVVLINGSEIVSNTKVDANALGLEGIRRELLPFSDKQKGVVSFQILIGQKSLGYDRQTMELLECGLESFGRRAGFHEARVSVTAYVEWDQKMARVNEKTRVQSEGNESSVGDEKVKAYPVQTILSWYLVGTSDCVVDIIVPLSIPGRNQLDPIVRESIVKAVKQLKLNDQSSINFQIRRRLNSPEMISEFEKDDSISKSLGFRTQTVTTLGD